MHVRVWRMRSGISNTVNRAARLRLEGVVRDRNAAMIGPSSEGAEGPGCAMSRHSPSVGLVPLVRERSTSAIWRDSDIQKWTKPS